MKGKRIVFREKNRVELEEFTVDTVLGENEVLIKTLFSIVSAGTELACLAGLAEWAPFPFYPGYGAVGEVIATGRGVRDLKEGDRILTYSPHSSHSKARVLTLLIPDGLEPKIAVFARMANVSMTAVRVAQPELGDRVCVIGAGLVGVLAAQLFQLSGCWTVLVDKIGERLARARECGIKETFLFESDDLNAFIRNWTDGWGCEIVVEASGNPQAGYRAGALAAKNGQVVLLGSMFHRPLMENVTELLETIHLWGSGCITYKGAHEWRYPVAKDRQGFVKHSIERNGEIILRLLREGRLVVLPLLTHLVPPERSQEAYAGLREDPAQYQAVVFDWSGD
ncbi:MAG: zinc-binding alcohol dehydrogenase [Armatimonadetes bacterium]|nr:zinc-binding alcohol dehydrogenase [Armatimonadota bacterium]